MDGGATTDAKGASAGALPARAPVVWLAAPGTEATPSEAAKRTLEEWAKARGVTLALPVEAPPVVLPLDWSVAETVEQELARVRDALSALDFDAAERALVRAGSLLRAHPELPNAAWLRAEVERAWSARWLRGGDQAQAERAWQRAAGLDGGREAGLGERAFAPSAPITASIRFPDGDEADGSGLVSSGGSLVLDGAAIAPGDVNRTEGEHALVIVRPDGTTAWAEWITLAPGGVVRVEPPPLLRCSRQDVQRAAVAGEAVRATGVRCAEWVAAVMGPRDRVRLATCEGATCSPLVEVNPIAAVVPVTPRASVEAPHVHWPAWATWTLAAVGVAGAAVGIAAAAGAFRSTPAAETQYVNGGIQVHSF